MHDMSQQTGRQLIIRGITTGGSIFRPSDWAERLAGILSTFDLDSRINYSPYIHPTTLDGIKSIVVDKELEHLDSRAWHFVTAFARDNDLVMEEVA